MTLTFRPPATATPARPRPPAPARVRDTLTAAVLFLAILPPAVGFLRDQSPKLANENRAAAEPPPLAWKRWAFHTFPPMFEAYFNDRVGFREELLAARRAVTYDLLNDSPSPFIWVGRGEWLFMNTVGTSDGHPAFVPPAGPNYDAWADAFADRRAYLAARGIEYVVLVVRDKQLVYPEYLPESYRRHAPPDPVPRLRGRLRGTGVEVVDALPNLLAAKEAGGELLFHTRDSHWTPAGAYAAYRALAADLERRVPGYRGKPREAFVPVPFVYPAQDMARAVGLPPDRQRSDYLLYTEPGSGLVPRPTDHLSAIMRATEDRLRHLDPTATARPGAPGPPTVLLHDSFGVDLIRLMASDFERFAAVGTYGLPLPVLDAERPKLVIQMLVDRTFRVATPANPPGVAGAAGRQFR